MMTYRVKRILWGLVFVAIGIGYLGTQLDWWDFTIFFPGWWTMLLILPAACWITACISIIYLQCWQAATFWQMPMRGLM